MEIEMAVKTQGTNVDRLNPGGGDIRGVACVTSSSRIYSTLEEIETTCLSATSRAYESALDTPGTANFTTQFDPENPVHIQLLNWKKLGKTLVWAVGFRQQDAIEQGVDPDGPESTTDSNGDYILDLPDTRSWIVFEGYMNSHRSEER